MDEVINYIMETPGNTNPNVLKGMLENYVESAGVKSFSIRAQVTDEYSIPSGKVITVSGLSTLFSPPADYASAENKIVVYDKVANDVYVAYTNLNLETLYLTSAKIANVSSLTKEFSSVIIRATIYYW